MRWPQPSPASQLLLLLPSAFQLAGATWNCDAVQDGIHWDFKALRGVHTVNSLSEDGLHSYNTTWQINPCGPIRKNKDDHARDQCPLHTQVCGIETETYADDNVTHVGVIPVAGDLNGVRSDVAVVRLKTSELAADKGLEGLRVRLKGGKTRHRDEQAIVEFLCDPDREGTEGNEKEGDGGEDGDEADAAAARRRRADDAKAPEGRSLTFVSYEKADEKNLNTLTLRWKTRYACESVARGDGKKGGWGFFTWLIIIIFLGVAAYLIFGSYVNYSRYGYQGWDLLPHGDTIRDLPYLLKDWARRVMSTLQGNSRGGYSAV